MSSLTTIAAVTVLTLAGMALWFVPMYRRFAGRRTVTCPETGTDAFVEVNALRYSATSLSDHPSLQLKGCSRWPERVSCGQDCLPQVAKAASERAG
jgi:hypothetical protein